MRHELLRASVCAVVLLLALSEVGVAQTSLQQQMPNYQSGPASAAAVNRNRAGVPLGAPNGELKVVPEDFAKLKLAPGFLVSLSVLDDSDFTGSFRIDDHGDIAVPILGTVHIAGETAAEAREQIRKQLLAEKILNDPQVTFTIVEYTAPEITIIGEVSSPGKYPLLVPRTLVDVLALAGGPTLTAGNEVQITPGNTETEPILVHYSRATNPRSVGGVFVHPGDTVQVKRAGIVYVLGAVTRPGGYVMQEDGTLSVLQAMSLANGTAQTASIKTVYLLRRNPDGTEVDIALSYKGMTQGKYGDMRLQATDILFVPTSTMKSILIYSQGIVAAAASSAIYVGAVH
jgi:polysaccharide biosynthesis/export protein